MSKISENGHNIDLSSGDVNPIEPSYFERRLGEIGITVGNNFIESTQPDYSDYPDTTRERPTHKLPLFEETEKGDIKINYFRLDGWYYSYKAGGEGWGKRYSRIRYKQPKIDINGKERKYDTPFGSKSLPYFPPQIISKYQAKEEIKLLVITEGEFKAVAGCNHGLDVIGISGIQNLYNDKKELHPDVEELLAVCKVKKVIFLTDADTLTIKYKADEDLALRPSNFFAAVSNFRKAMQHAMDKEDSRVQHLTDVYYGHILTKFNSTGQKGLDDLLLRESDKQKIKEDLKSLTYASEFFFIQQAIVNEYKIKEHFGLTAPLNFAQVYKDYIQEKEFVFKNQTYVYHEETQTVEKIKHKDVEKYMRVGCDWFKLVQVPNKFKELEESIEKWKPGEISRDYLKKYPNFMDEIAKYDSWCNIPSMNGDYQPVHSNCFNLFRPIKHVPVKGPLDTTLFFIKHLFGGEGDCRMVGNNFIECPKLGDPFTIALDYLTLLYHHPMQILPVICLVSPENATGKSTFLKWLQDIFGSNATILEMSRFKMNFNSHYISKFIIGIDEGFLDVEKKEEKERLKKLATDERQYLEFKGADVKEIDFYGKIIISSNDADSLMKIEAGEIRWFVIRVPTFKSKGHKEDPDFRLKLRNEIPAFLDFIKNREVFHPKESRAWFNPDYLVTDQLLKIIEKTRNYLDRVVDDFIEEMFTSYSDATITMPLDDLVDLINRTNKWKLDKLQVKSYLKEKKKMSLKEPKRISYPVGFDESGNQLVHKCYARYYEFNRSEWITVTEKNVNEAEDLHQDKTDELPF